MLKIGDVVIIRNDTFHEGQMGIICNISMIGDKPNYSVHTYEPNGDRFWCTGVHEDDGIKLEYQGYNIIPMLESWQFWMNSQYCRKTGMKLKPHKFGQRYNYWKKRKEKGPDKARR